MSLRQELRWAEEDRDTARRDLERARVQHEGYERRLRAELERQEQATRDAKATARQDRRALAAALAPLGFVDVRGAVNTVDMHHERRSTTTPHRTRVDYDTEVTLRLSFEGQSPEVETLGVALGAAGAPRSTR